MIYFKNTFVFFIFFDIFHTATMHVFARCCIVYGYTTPVKINFLEICRLVSDSTVFLNLLNFYI